jgi:hypothetical protein
MIEMHMNRIRAESAPATASPVAISCHTTAPAIPAMFAVNSMVFRRFSISSEKYRR